MTHAPWIVRGGGLAGWATAAVLASELPRGQAVRLVESGETDAGSLAIATLDAESILLRVCGRSAGDLVVEAGGGFHLGTALDGWSKLGKTWVCPQEPLPLHQGLAIHDLVLATAAGAGRRDAYAEFAAPLRFQARAAEAGRYAEPAADRASPRSLLRPGVALDADRLADVLKARALSLGVIVSDGLPPGEAKLIVDARPQGDAGEWHDRSTAFGFDRIITGRRAVPGARALHLTSIPLPFGHLTACPVLGGERVAIAWDSAGGEAALASATASLTRIAERSARPGWSRTPWRGDTVVIGPAAACLGPLFGQDLALLDRQLSMLVELLPSEADSLSACAGEYNRRQDVDAGHRADLVQLALRRCAHPAAWWSGRRAAPPSDPLARRLQQFQLRNRSVLMDGDPFDPPLWLSTMTALGYVPRSHDPCVDQLDGRSVAAHLGRTVQAFDATLAAMPAHDDVLAKMAEPPAEYEWPDFAEL